MSATKDWKTPPNWVTLGHDADALGAFLDDAR